RQRVPEIGRRQVFQRLAHEDGSGPRQIHGDERVEHAGGDPALGDQPAEARALGEVRVEVERITVAGDLRVELDFLRGDGLDALRALPDRETERAHTVESILDLSDARTVSRPHMTRQWLAAMMLLGSLVVTHPSEGPPPCQEP